MEGWMAGPSSRKTEAGWCRVFHQSTENLMTGRLTTPIRVRIDTARAARAGSSMVRHKARMPQYMRKRTSMEVRRASQTQ